MVWLEYDIYISSYLDIHTESSTCPDEYFSRCTNGQCIAFHMKCNKVRNCNDGSDEEHCGKYTNNSWYKKSWTFQRYIFKCDVCVCYAIVLSNYSNRELIWIFYNIIVLDFGQDAQVSSVTYFDGKFNTISYKIHVMAH